MDSMERIKVVLAFALIFAGVGITGFFSLLIYYMNDMKRNDEAQAHYVLGLVSLLPLIIYLLILLFSH